MLQLARSIESVEANIRKYQDELSRGNHFLVHPLRISQIKDWYYCHSDLHGWQFGPSKYIGYESMSAQLYEKAFEGSGPFSGGTTQAHLARKKWFMQLEASSTLFNEFQENINEVLARFGRRFRKDAKIFIPVDYAKRQRIQKREIDQDKKKKVEDTAVNIVTAWYEKEGYSVRSVEKENKGWDLEAERGKEKIRIEVKGRSIPQAIVELSPNEYTTFRVRRADYRLAVVADALKAEPILLLCRAGSRGKLWQVHILGCRSEAEDSAWTFSTIQKERSQELSPKEAVSACIGICMS